MKLFKYLLICAALALTGCTFTRNAPLISSEIQINDSANNNEIPLVP